MLAFQKYKCQHSIFIIGRVVGENVRPYPKGGVGTTPPLPGSRRQLLQKILKTYRKSDFMGRCGRDEGTVT